MKIIWLIFAIMFFILALTHLDLTTKSISHFENKCKVKAINGVPLGMSEFTSELNEYIDQVNNSNRFVNFLTMVGYLLAGLTALWSFLLCCLNPLKS